MDPILCDEKTPISPDSSLFAQTNECQVFSSGFRLVLLTQFNRENENGARIKGMNRIAEERFEFRGDGNECLYRFGDKYLVVAISPVA